MVAPKTPPVEFLRTVFGDEVAGNKAIVGAVHAVLQDLVATSTREVVAKCVEDMNSSK